MNSCAVTSRRAQRGTILIAVLGVLVALTGLALLFCRETRTEVAISANDLARSQADAICRGALQQVAHYLTATDGSISADGLPCQAVALGPGYYWLLRPDMSASGSVTYGLVDEACRVNLNSAPLEMLSLLPGATPEIAASIVDWRDPDNDMTGGGAENEYYAILPQPRHAKSGPLETVDELLLVKDVTPDIFLGSDLNRNGMPDSTEAGGFGTGSTLGSAAPLWQFVTTCSRDPNVDSQQQGRININRGISPVISALSNVLPQNRMDEVAPRIVSGRPFDNVLDFYFKLGLTQDEFRQVVDRFTSTRGTFVPGLINVNRAPKEVLMCLPSLESRDADALIAARTGENANLANLAWVVNVLPREKAVAIGGLITTRSFQFTADIVAATRDGRAFKRFQAVIDASENPPRVLCWRDLTALGWPLDPAILRSMRQGKAPGAANGVPA